MSYLQGWYPVWERRYLAHSIAVTAETIFYIPGYGLRTATSALIGISLGEHNRQKYEMVTKMSIVVTMAMMVFNGILLYVVSYPLMRLLTSSTQVAVIGASMLKLVAFSEPFFGLMIIMEGIFYGLGKTKYPFFVGGADLVCCTLCEGVESFPYSSLVLYDRRQCL